MTEHPIMGNLTHKVQELLKAVGKLIIENPESSFLKGIYNGYQNVSILIKEGYVTD